MRMNFLSLVILVFLVGATAWADPITLNFDSLKDSVKVTTQFAGLTFSNATTLTAGVTLNEFEYPPKSGSNALVNDAGAMTITFTLPVTSIEGYFTYDSRLTLTAFDANGNQIGSLSSQFLSNLALSGAAGSKPNELLSFSAAGGIARIVISTSGSFALDDFRYNTTTAAPVPEPATVSLLASGGLLLLGLRKKRVK